MNLDNFQVVVSQQYTPDITMTEKDMIMNNILGIVGEAGEIADVAKKIYFIGREDIGEREFKEEIGDLLWHIACLSNILEIELGDCLDYNYNKLTSRYGELKGPRSTK